MYNPYKIFPCPYWANNYRHRHPPCPYRANTQIYYPDPASGKIDHNSATDLMRSEAGDNSLIELKDYGPEPFAVNIEEAAKQNDTYRTALWTGNHLQLTLMSINVGEDIGLEIHPHTDQFIRIEEGEGLVKMGNRRDNLDFQKRVQDGFAFIIPAGKWHNLVNTGSIPIKLYSIYAPPQHPHGTVHETKADSEAAENNQH
ncbi:cupin domain-containing protein [Clostridium luticellarii]|uniref:Cupin domain protein n=1 Tax=Clostridium luticellarii TaxID=1691940 RepID=A0A2T0BQG0_9CLOT|nr:cupin domain-containing protein [Clostridium luticellarii]MCI1946239.1 cupin domain-containing protein [Clostridium luticellarii]MCI1969369.1 cupin domain-containing protein [Clostridium luticellarii]MCI1996404.1 cupin domain-containing protein [Clostridium luticellarii]MCI2040757.1 cupin domain-containing protein [Clostridium luticellarii]PRR86096.1 Cupin domain protein [Clostridium luticellarii]